jgi:asparagine synthase (glutamine-hydrolysing)
MCGIAGIWNLNGSALNIEALKTFTDSISHRGPDGSGYELLENNHLGLGHRRLSILDLSEAGKQPMFSAGGELATTFNGEVYNFIEIREELKKDGFAFKTETDTEVILAAYTKWGKACLNKFNGMFAIAIWDAKEKELFIARDRFGVKPLYYLYIPGQIFAFASETLAFKKLAGYTREVQQAYLTLALHDPSLLEGSDKTIFKNIWQLLPGHFLTLRPDSELNVKTWWVTKDNPVKVPEKYGEQVEEFKALFENACKLRMRSDVSLATALSGGLDSSSVYCSLHKLKNSSAAIERLPANWQQAFVATFPGTTVDERSYAEKVVKYVGGKALYIVPDYGNLAKEVIDAGKLFDGIIFTPINAISDVYRSMRKNGITVSMDGHGVDEMMYGYNTYVFEAFYDAIKKQNFEKAEDHARVICGLSPKYNYEYFEKIISQARNASPLRKIASRLKNTFAKPPEKPRLTPDPASWIAAPDLALVREITQQQVRLNSGSPAEDLLYEDFNYKDLPINLRDFDRASMQHGIEIRMPFMDYRLVSYVFSLPQSSKVGGGFTKRILRDAMKGHMPEDIRTRTLKIGIGGPDEWYKNELKEYIFDTFHSGKFQNAPYWDGKTLYKQLQEVYANNTVSKTHYNQIWGLISAQLILND